MFFSAFWLSDNGKFHKQDYDTNFAVKYMDFAIRGTEVKKMILYIKNIMGGRF